MTEPDVNGESQVKQSHQRTRANTKSNNGTTESKTKIQRRPIRGNPQ